MHHHAEPGPDKIPVRIDSSLEAIIPGFLANRMQHALLREVFWLLDNGITTAEGIDDAAHNLSALHHQLNGLKDFLARVEIVYVH